MAIWISVNMDFCKYGRIKMNEESDACNECGEDHQELFEKAHFLESDKVNEMINEVCRDLIDRTNMAIEEAKSLGAVSQEIASFVSVISDNYFTRVNGTNIARYVDPDNYKNVIDDYMDALRALMLKETIEIAGREVKKYG
jgi:hypothetical protein